MPKFSWLYTIGLFSNFFRTVSKSLFALTLGRKSSCWIFFSVLLLWEGEWRLCLPKVIVVFQNSVCPWTEFLAGVVKLQVSITSQMCHLDRILLWEDAKDGNSVNDEVVTGREIAPNTGANATKCFTLATKSWKLVAKLATRTFHYNLTKRYREFKKFAKINPRQTSSLSLFPKRSTCISIDN